MIIEYVHFSTTVSTCQWCLLVFFCFSQLRLFDLLPRINIHLSPPRIIPRPIHVQITLELGLPLLKERPDTLLLIPTASTCQHQSTPKRKNEKLTAKQTYAPKPSTPANAPPPHSPAPSTSTRDSTPRPSDSPAGPSHSPTRPPASPPLPWWGTFQQRVPQSAVMWAGALPPWRRGTWRASTQ